MAPSKREWFTAAGINETQMRYGYFNIESASTRVRVCESYLCVNNDAKIITITLIVLRYNHRIISRYHFGISRDVHTVISVKIRVTDLLSLTLVEIISLIKRFVKNRDEIIANMIILIKQTKLLERSPGISHPDQLE